MALVEMPPCKVGTRGRPGATKARAESENQPQLATATATKIVELSQVVQQQAELINRQAEEARKRVEELTRRQSQLFDASMQRFPVPQGENVVGLAVELIGPEIKMQPP